MKTSTKKEEIDSHVSQNTPDIWHICHDKLWNSNVNFHPVLSLYGNMRLRFACLVRTKCALNQNSVDKSFQLDGAKRNKSCMHVLTSATTYKKAHRVCCRPDQHSFSGRGLKFISLANLFCLHSSMRLRSCFLLAKMLSIEFIQAYIQNSSDHHENFDEKRRNRFACITKHAWHMTYLSWQALEFQCEFPPCPQLVRQHETALCMPGADKVCFESKFSWQNHFSWTVQKETKAACMSWHRQLLTKRHTVCVAGRINTVSLGVVLSSSPSPTSSACTAAWDWGLASSLQRCFQ